MDLLVVVLDPEVLSAELPPEHPAKSKETAATAKTATRPRPLVTAKIFDARNGLIPRPYAYGHLRVYRRSRISCISRLPVPEAETIGVLGVLIP